MVELGTRQPGRVALLAACLGILLPYFVMREFREDLPPASELQANGAAERAEGGTEPPGKANPRSDDSDGGRDDQAEMQDWPVPSSSVDRVTAERVMEHADRAFSEGHYRFALAMTKTVMRGCRDQDVADRARVLYDRCRVEVQREDREAKEQIRQMLDHWRELRDREEGKNPNGR